MSQSLRRKPEYILEGCIVPFDIWGIFWRGLLPLGYTEYILEGCIVPLGYILEGYIAPWIYGVYFGGVYSSLAYMYGVYFVGGQNCDVTIGYV